MKEKLKTNKYIFIIGKWILILYHNYILDSFRYLRYLCVKYKLISNSKYDKLKVYKEIHKGERCFIVATAPSLTYQDLDLIKGEYSFSVNSIVKILGETEWRPTYYGIQDSQVYAKIEQEIINSGLNPIFVGHRLQKKYKSAETYIPFFHYSCNHGRHGELLPLSSGFSSDVSLVVYDGYSIVHSLIQIAVYMGFAEIYLLGCDCSYDVRGKQHFVESGFYDKQASTVGERMIYAHSIVKKYADEHNIKIFNATRGGMLEVYGRIDLDSLF